MNMKRLSCFWLKLLLCLATAPALAANVTEEALGEVVERQLDVDVGVTQWVQDPNRIAEEEGDTLELRETVNDALETIKLANLVEPIRFESGVAAIPASTVESLGAILARMQDRLNVRLHLIGHADNQPLSPRLVEIYGDNAGLSRERAGEVAEYFQTALALPPEAVSYEWAGDTMPVSTNETAAGRALNRRVEVEVWYDEPRQRVALEEFLVPHEIQRVKVCRMETVCKLRYVDGHAKRARVQNLVAPLQYDEEAIDVHDVFVERVRQALQNLAEKQNVVVKFECRIRRAFANNLAQHIWQAKCYDKRVKGGCRHDGGHYEVARESEYAANHGSAGKDERKARMLRA
jgi:outer membrane protein OmpA-like peptidoglycan-associated protein